MNKIYEQINESLKKVDLSDESTIQEAASALLTEELTSGDTVSSVHDDETFPYAGVKGIYIGDSDKGGGWANVRYADGTVVPIQRSLLVKA